MSALKSILRELQQAALKGGVHARDKLHLVADNLDGHLDTVIRQVRDADSYDNTVDVSIRRFNRNPNHNSDDYNNQLNEQLDTLQNMPLADWLRNRIEFLDNGRSSESRRAQQNARDVEYRDTYDEMRDRGQSPEQARQGTEQWLATRAATHRLDGVAGGDVTDISGVGDTQVNSSLGSQWRSRVGDMDRAVIDYINANPGVDLDSVFVNITLR